MHKSINEFTSFDHSPYEPNTNACILPKVSKCCSHALVQCAGTAATAGIAFLAGTAVILLPNSSVCSGTIGFAAMAGFALTAGVAWNLRQLNKSSSFVQILVDHLNTIQGLH